MLKVPDTDRPLDTTASQPLTGRQQDDRKRNPALCCSTHQVSYTRTLISLWRPLIHDLLHLPKQGQGPTDVVTACPWGPGSRLLQPEVLVL